ncbi:hypothetical protein PG985_009325 [Apiospora marii]|uniref:uncharacterized protein n=1 Tax=Apiospora marii TaxID=335849 RepID=UPI00312D4036
MATKISPPGELLTTYKQYKKDTEYIAGWLAENATKCGFKLQNTPTTSGRLKGKARKQAWEAGIKRPQYTVKISEFVSMAKFIANLNAKPDIPQTLGHVFNRAIKARRECTEWYEKTGHGDSLSNKRHTHFTNIRVDSWEALRPFQTIDKKRINSGARPDTKDFEHEGSLPFSNRFSKLQVLDPTDSDHEPAQADSAAEAQHESDASLELPDVTPAVIERDEETTEEDFFFAILSFLSELKRLRHMVRNIWSEYASGELELTIASLLTNTVIQLVRRAEQALELSIQRPKRYPASMFPVWTFPALFLNSLCQNRAQLAIKEAHDFVSPSYYLMHYEGEHAEFCLWPVYNAVKFAVAYHEASLKEIDDEGAPPVLLPYDVTEDVRAGKTFERLRDLLPGLHIIAYENPNTAFDDEITHGISEILQTFTLPIWAIFGIQLLLDTQDILQDAPSRQPLEELQSHTRIVVEAMNRFASEETPYGLDATYHKTATELINGAINCFKPIILDDASRRLVRKMLADYSFSEEKLSDMSCVNEEYFFLKKHPLCCGLLKYSLHFQLHAAGLHHEKHWSGLTALVHVYSACQFLYPDDPVWPDMELFLHNQDLNHLLVGGSPKTMDEAFTKFCLAFGMPAQSLAASNRRAAVQFKHRSKWRLVSDPNPMGEVLQSWILLGENRDDPEDWLLKLMAVVYDPKSFKRIFQRNGPFNTSAEFHIEQWSHESENIGHLLKVMTPYLQMDNDLYFNWLQMITFASNIWGDVANTSYDKTGQRPRSAVTAAGEALVQARQVEWLATPLGTDSITLLTSHAHQLKAAWRSIQRLCTDGQGDSCIAFMLDNTETRDPSRWVSKQLDKLYKNWPQERLEESHAWRTLQE